jgi:ATPase subunit of ABC transporter with duplicated ATPase domains
MLKGVIDMLIVRLEQVSLSYGTFKVFDDISLSLNDGEKIGLIGPNGAGKSSLFKLLMGIEQPNKGERILRRGTKVAYLPQEYAGLEVGDVSALAEVLGGNLIF